MSVITNTKTVTFAIPFSLGGIDEVPPAGAYTVETDAELLEGLPSSATLRQTDKFAEHKTARSWTPHPSSISSESQECMETMPRLFGEKFSYDVHCSHCGRTNERPLDWLMARSAIACDWCDCLIHLSMAESRNIAAEFSQSCGIAST